MLVCKLLLLLIKVSGYVYLFGYFFFFFWYIDQNNVEFSCCPMDVLVKIIMLIFGYPLGLRILGGIGIKCLRYIEEKEEERNFRDMEEEVAQEETQEERKVIRIRPRRN